MGFLQAEQGSLCSQHPHPAGMLLCWGVRAALEDLVARPQHFPLLTNQTFDLLVFFLLFLLPCEEYVLLEGGSGGEHPSFPSPAQLQVSNKWSTQNLHHFGTPQRLRHVPPSHCLSLNPGLLLSDLSRALHKQSNQYHLFSEILATETSPSSQQVGSAAPKGNGLF